ncbi:MAG: MarR family transcriptional regulator [Flavobacteriales bacterium]|nr:MarR family transcriptional regulator [Flavobacteriales bacterium]
MNSTKSDLIDFTIRHSWHRISRMYNQMAAVEGMTMSYGFILMMVEKQGTPSTQLGPKMGMEATSLSRTINAMELDGLIRRSSSEKDKRITLVFLTELGVQKRKMVKKFILEFNEKLTTKLKKKDLEGFFTVMNALDESIDEIVDNKKVINEKL